MNRFPLFLFAVILSLAANAQTPNLQYYYAEAKKSYAAGDHKKYYEMLTEAHKLHPYHQGILYQLGIACALNGKTDEAIPYLKQAIQINAKYDLAIEDLKSLRNIPAFEKLMTLQTQLQQAIIHSDTAFIVKDRTLHVESIAAGEIKNVFYLGSIHKRKIVRVDEKGNTSDFTSAAQDGLASVFAVKVNASKKNTVGVLLSHARNGEL